MAEPRLAVSFAPKWPFPQLTGKRVFPTAPLALDSEARNLFHDPRLSSALPNVGDTSAACW